MRSDRLSLALDTGAVTLPDAGPITVWNARDASDLMALPRPRCHVVQGFYPDHQALAAAGIAVSATVPPGAVAGVVLLPRAKDHARALLAEAAATVAPGGPVIVDGFKTDGVESLWRELRARGIAVSPPVSKAHGKCFAFPAGPGLEDWAAAPRAVEGGFVTLPGVFSADGPDRGSALLAAALPEYLPGYVVDLGAGWGYLARSVLACKGVKRLDLVEADHAALTCARQNVTDPRARFFWGDATAYRADGYADHVVTNPPFHHGRDADPDLGAAFIGAAARMLGPQGVLWLVANRHLPYAGPLKSLFREVDEIGGDTVFRLTRASHPLRPRR
jgi:16S rRNA (guanine1207-N2)-methyltransferase